MTNAELILNNIILNAGTAGTERNGSCAGGASLSGAILNQGTRFVRPGTLERAVVVKMFSGTLVGGPRSLCDAGNGGNNTGLGGGKSGNPGCAGSGGSICAGFNPELFEEGSRGNPFDPQERSQKRSDSHSPHL